MTEYLFGETVRIGNTFTDTSDVVYDPDTISLTITDPEGTAGTPVTYAAGEVKRTSIGIYYYDYIIPAAAEQGYHVAVWSAVIGTQSDVSETQFYARSSAEKLYVSVAEVKSALMSTGVTMGDDDIRNTIRAAMGEVDTITGRKFTNGNTKTEWFNTDQPNPDTGVTTLFLTYMPVQTITSVKEYNTSNVLAKTFTDDEYWIDDNGILELSRTTFSQQRHRVECVYTYGYTSIPISISKLCSVISQIDVLRHYMVMQDDKITGFSMPDIAQVQLGETYMTAKLAIAGLEKKKITLVKEIGNLRNDTFSV